MNWLVAAGHLPPKLGSSTPTRKKTRVGGPPSSTGKTLLHEAGSPARGPCVLGCRTVPLSNRVGTPSPTPCHSCFAAFFPNGDGLRHTVFSANGLYRLPRREGSDESPSRCEFFGIARRTLGAARLAMPKNS